MVRFLLNNRTQKGQLFIELVLVIALLAIILPAILTGYVASSSGKAQLVQRTDAVSLVKQASEVVRSLRESAWSEVATNGTYHPVRSGSGWELQPGSENIGTFTRQIIINDTRRLQDGTLVTSGGEVDPSTKHIQILVSWSTPYSSSISEDVYLSRYMGNSSTGQTLFSELNLGTKTNVAVTNTAGGEVILGAGGGGDWCDPNLSISALNLPKSGVANAISAIEGTIFAGTGENASGESFVKVNVSNTNPPVASILGSFSNYKTNDVFGDANYGYIATDTNSKEVVIVSISSTPYTESGYFDASGNTDANSVFIVGNTGYVVQGNRLRNFSLSTCSGGNRTGSCPAIDADGAATSATGTSVYVVGNYAYVSISGHARELEIFDVSNPSNIVRTGYADVNGESANDVYVNSSGTRAYIVTNASLSLPELFIIDTTNKNCNDCSDIGRFNAGTSVNLKAVEVVPGNKAVIIGQGGEEYQVIDISSETSPTRCGGMHVDSGINDSASILEQDGDAFTYILTRDSSSELKLVEGGPGGQYSSSGTFESSTIDLGSEVAINYADFTVDQPVNSEIKFQYAVADAVNNSCSLASFVFLGPDGTANTYYTGDSSVYLSNDGLAYENPGRCFRYKVFLSTQDTLLSPTFYDFSLNYSP